MDHSDINVESPLLQTIHVEASGNNIIFLQPLDDANGYPTALHPSLYETVHYQEDRIQDEKQEYIQPQNLYILPRNVEAVRDTSVQNQVTRAAQLRTYGSESTCTILHSATKLVDDSLLATEEVTRKVHENPSVLESNSVHNTVSKIELDFNTLETQEGCHSNDCYELPEENLVNAEKKHEITSLPNPLTALQNFVSIADTATPPRAVASLPAALVRRRGAVCAGRPLPPRVRFGPVQGVERSVSAAAAAALAARAARGREPVFLLRRRDGAVAHIDTGDADKANWLSLLPLGGDTANVWLHQVDAQLWAVTLRPLARRAPLTLGYSKQYAELHALPAGQPVLDLDAELSQWPSQWWCFECSRAMSSYADLQKHFKMYHKEDTDNILKRRRYKCRHCTKRFVRLFTLKRHVSMFCPNRKPTNPPESPPVEQNFADYSVHGDDSYRTPSDESLHNFTNLLDLSTNLFDTDRMPNLDISTKSDNELNFYGLKDENRLDAFEFPDFPDGDCEDVNKSEVHYLRSSSPISCPYCKQHMLRGKLKQHARVCKARKFTCVCGREFARKEKLQRHVRTAHKVTTPTVSKATQEAVVETTESQYQCEHCRLAFKRRGMLLNHLHKSHAGGGGVPLLVRRRTYPCPLCPNLYQSVAKRHKHVLAKHPGATYDRRACVVGAPQPAAASACAHCPRQYATRAKMLQHARKMHPHAAPPAANKVPTSTNVTHKKKTKSTSVPSVLPTMSSTTKQELDYREATPPHPFLDSDRTDSLRDASDDGGKYRINLL